MPILEENEDSTASAVERILQRWHPAKNLTPTPESLQGIKTLSVWWLGECGHEWQKTPNKMLMNPTCSRCKSLAFTHPELAAQWGKRNAAGDRTGKVLTPEDVTSGSKTPVWWECNLGHEWETSPDNRRRGGCPICSGSKLLEGFNDIASTHPHLALQWHPTKNPNFTPNQTITAGGEHVWWLCEQGHEWSAYVSNRKKGTGCPVCTNNQVLSGYNDLATMSPELAAQWHPTKNSTLASEIIFGSGKRAWWLCEQGHEWEAIISSRVRHGCPYCTGQRTITGVTDVETIHPELAEQWHPTKNGDVELADFTAGSNYAPWWTCDKSHEWTARIADRIGQHTGCPDCVRPSQPETAISEFIMNLGFSVEQNNRKLLAGKEIDIYIPAKKIGVEYNGLHWHTEQRTHKAAHYDKWLAAKEAGIQLIQIWEDDWKSKPELVKKMIAHKLGAGTSGKIFARKTKVVSVTALTAKQFLNENHIQGFASGGSYLALQDLAGEYVALLVLKTRGEGVYEIVRYATNKNVVGGFTKLLVHAEKNLPIKTFITFADHTVSDGSLYESNGFIADKEVKPDYMYVLGKQRKHKFGYRLKRFRNDPSLQYQEGLTERELALLNNLPRIWDAGKTRYVKQVAQ